MRISAAVAGLAIVAAAGLPAGAAMAARADVKSGRAAVDESRWQQQQRGRSEEKANRRPDSDQQPAQAQPREGRGREAARGQQGRGREAAPGQQRRDQQAAPGQQDRGRQAAPGQQRRDQQAAPAQQGRGREAAPGQQRRDPQAAPGQQGRGREAAPGQQRRGGPAEVEPARSGAAPAARRGGKPDREELNRGVSSLPPDLRSWVASRRRHERLAAGAVVHGLSRGLDPERITWRRDSDAVELLNRSGELLVVLDDRRARELGFWEVRRLGDRRPSGNAPAFCRSGAGHPVHGRQWCLERGFGLGSRPGTIWSQGRVDDVVFRRDISRERLMRDALVGVLGEVVFNRLAVHALGMGYTQPLHGQWTAEPGAPRLLHIYAGDDAVAELVDLNQNHRADVIYVLQPL